MLSGPNRKGSVVRGDVFVVDEDTDLLDPIFQNGGYVDPQRKPSRNGGNQKGKPEMSSKHLEENITTEKRTAESDRTSSLFPGKPSEDIIDLDTGDAPKKPSAGSPVLPRNPSSPNRTSTDSGQLREETDDPTRTVSSTPRIEVPMRSTTRRAEHHVKHLDRERPGTVTIVSVDGDLVRGSDGKMYRLQRGPAGRMGPPGPEVSDTRMLLLLVIIRNYCFCICFVDQESQGQRLGSPRLLQPRS